MPDWVSDGFPEYPFITLDKVRHHLLTKWGPPQPSLDTIHEDVVLLTDHAPPEVWFQETIA
jgi:hypothetical protein